MGDNRGYKASDVSAAINKLSNLQKAAILQRFFKTGKGEYGEGDKFLGIVVPQQRKIAKEFKDIPLGEISKLLNSGVHEYRLTALFILVDQFARANERTKRKIYEFYLSNTTKINNWDLVDLSAPNIVGTYLIDRSRQILYSLAGSDNLWERRISILSTLAFTKKGEFKDTLAISRLLIMDKHDLIHKAVGWMLREVGKRDMSLLRNFLDEESNKMDRTMLRYAIEKFPENLRKHYLR